MNKLKTFFSEASRPKINCFVAGVSGAFFFLGWWIMVDLNSIHPKILKDNWVYYLPILFGTFSFLVTSCVPLSVVKGTSHGSNPRVKMALLLLFFGLIAAFGSLIGAGYILVHDFLMAKVTTNLWPGFSILLQNLCVFSSNLLMKFGTRNEERF